MKKYDLIIIGCGFAGLTTSLMMAKLGFKSLIIEKRNLDFILKNNDSYGRAFAMSQGSKDILDKFDLWQLYENDICPIDDIRITDSDSPMFLHFDHKLIGNLPMGYMIENHIMIRNLLIAAKENELIEIKQEIDKFEFDAGLGYVELTVNQDKYFAPLMLAADGKFSHIRKICGIDTIDINYEQIALVMKVKHEKHHRNIAHEKFFKSGPFAILPLKSGYESSIVWTEETKIAKAILEHSNEEILAIVKEKFGDYIGDVEFATNIFSYPLSATIAKNAYTNRVCLIADSLHSIHPLAGQGFNVGIRDINELVDIIAEYDELGLDYGSDAALDEYEKIRKSDYMAMTAITHQINWLFSNNKKSLRALRKIGISTIDKVPTLKKFFMKYAMGKKESA